MFQGLRRPLDDQEKVEIMIAGMRPEIRQALAGIISIQDGKDLRVAAQRAEKLLRCSDHQDLYGVEAVMADPSKAGNRDGMRRHRNLEIKE